MVAASIVFDTLGALWTPYTGGRVLAIRRFFEEKNGWKRKVVCVAGVICLLSLIPHVGFLGEAALMVARGFMFVIGILWMVGGGVLGPNREWRVGLIAYYIGFVAIARANASLSYGLFFVGVVIAVFGTAYAFKGQRLYEEKQASSL